MPDQFWSMTWEEVNVACYGYEKRLARSLEMERFIGTVLRNAHRAKGERAISPQELMPLMTDRKPKKVELMSVEEYERAKELFSRVKWQIQN